MMDKKKPMKKKMMPMSMKGKLQYVYGSGDDMEMSKMDMKSDKGMKEDSMMDKKKDSMMMKKKMTKEEMAKMMKKKKMMAMKKKGSSSQMAMMENKNNPYNKMSSSM